MSRYASKSYSYAESDAWSPVDGSDSSIFPPEKQNAYPRFTKDDFLSPNFRSHNLNKIVRESILLGGGGAAFLLQVANPGVAAGVNEHSTSSYRVTDRLRTTMTYVYCMSFGTPQEKKAITNMINRMHDNVSGTITEGRNSGQTYSANDPALQLWVAATIYATGTQMYERIFGDIYDDDFHEQVYQEYSMLAVSLKVPPEMWPPTRKDFWDYWELEVSLLEITQHARDVAKDVLALEKAPWYLRILLPSVRMCTAELLPERIRREYEIKKHHRTYKVLEFLVKATYPALPLKWRSYPVKYYMNDMRRKLKANQIVIGKEANGNMGRYS